jgi:iron complex transport system substrate-binding protein
VRSLSTPLRRAGPLRGLACALALLWLAPQAWAATWTDALGRRVEVPDRPRRIVSLAPSVTEILFALGLGDRVAGVTNFCDYPPAARSKPRVGSYADPSLEALVALKPDLVVASADSTKPQLVGHLERLGVPVYVVYPQSFREVAATIRNLGRVAGAPKAGEDLATSMEDTARRVGAAVAGRPKPRVLLCVMVRPLVVAGPGTFVDDLLRLAGGVNVVPPGPSRYPTWGPEALLAQDPDVIVATPHPGDPEPRRAFDRWPELRAVRTKRVATVEANWIQRPGPRLADGLRALAKALYRVEVPASAGR